MATRAEKRKREACTWENSRIECEPIGQDITDAEMLACSCLGTAHGTEEVILWDLCAGRNVWKVEFELVNGLAFSPFTHKMVVVGILKIGGNDTVVIKCWDLNTGTALILTDRVHGHTDCEMNHMGTQLLTWYGNELVVWDLDRAVKLVNISGRKFSHAGYSGNDSKIISCHAESNSLIVWDAATGMLVHSFCVLGPSGHAGRIATSADGSYCATVNRGRLQVWELEKGAFISAFEGVYVQAICFDSDGSTLCTLMSNPSILVCCDLATSTITTRCDLRCSMPTALDTALYVSMDSIIVGFAFMDHTLYAYNVFDKTTGQRYVGECVDAGQNKLYLRTPITILM
jgi:WD40 repeat protein